MAKQFIEIATNEAKSRGYDVTIRDISYAILKNVLKNETMAYTVVFGVPATSNSIKDYETLDATKYLLRYIKSQLEPKKEEKSDEDLLKELKAKSKKKTSDEDKGYSDISAEENKDAIIRRLGELKEMYDSKEISAKDYVKLDLEARVKLADKFDVVEESKQSVYILPPTYNMVCPHTNRECFQMTKEYAIEHFNLIEKP